MAIMPLSRRSMFIMLGRIIINFNPYPFKRGNLLKFRFSNLLPPALSFAVIGVRVARVVIVSYWYYGSIEGIGNFVGIGKLC